jgi:hypothetical protein
MRRVERAVYLTGGAVFVPVAATIVARFGLARWVASLPMLCALGIVAVVGNVSAVNRLRFIARALAARSRPVAPKPEPLVDASAVRDGVTP